MVTSDAGGRATRTLFTESMNVLALKHGCSAWCLGALIAFPHVIRTPHPRRARARLPPRTGCRTAETNFRAVRLRRARGAAFWRRTARVPSSELSLSTTNVQKLDYPNKGPTVPRARIGRSTPIIKLPNPVQHTKESAQALCESDSRSSCIV